MMTKAPKSTNVALGKPGRGELPPDSTKDAMNGSPCGAQAGVAGFRKHSGPGRTSAKTYCAWRGERDADKCKDNVGFCSAPISPRSNRIGSYSCRPLRGRRRGRGRRRALIGEDGAPDDAAQAVLHGGSDARQADLVRDHCRSKPGGL
jgi:hypothetical protein